MKTGIAMSRTAIALWLSAALLQVLAAVGLLIISYGDTFGLEQIAANGEKILQQLASQLPNTQSGASIRPLLAASNNAFLQISKLLEWIGAVLLGSVFVQFVGLFLLRRHR